jgi:hypothetical protein
MFIFDDLMSGSNMFVVESGVFSLFFGLNVKLNSPSCKPAVINYATNPRLFLLLVQS